VTAFRPVLRSSRGYQVVDVDVASRIRMYPDITTPSRAFTNQTQTNASTTKKHLLASPLPIDMPRTRARSARRTRRTRRGFSTRRRQFKSTAIPGRGGRRTSRGVMRRSSGKIRRVLLYPTPGPVQAGRAFHRGRFRHGGQAEPQPANRPPGGSVATPPRPKTMMARGREYTIWESRDQRDYWDPGWRQQHHTPVTRFIQDTWDNLPDMKGLATAAGTGWAVGNGLRTLIGSAARLVPQAMQTAFFNAMTANPYLLAGFQMLTAAAQAQLVGSIISTINPSMTSSEQLVASITSQMDGRVPRAIGKGLMEMSDNLIRFATEGVRNDIEQVRAGIRQERAQLEWAPRQPDVGVINPLQERLQNLLDFEQREREYGDAGVPLLSQSLSNDWPLPPAPKYRRAPRPADLEESKGPVIERDSKGDEDWFEPAAPSGLSGGRDHLATTGAVYRKGQSKPRIPYAPPKQGRSKRSAAPLQSTRRSPTSIAQAWEDLSGPEIDGVANMPEMSVVHDNAGVPDLGGSEIVNPDAAAEALAAEMQQHMGKRQRLSEFNVNRAADVVLGGNAVTNTDAGPIIIPKPTQLPVPRGAVSDQIARAAENFAQGGFLGDRFRHRNP